MSDKEIMALVAELNAHLVKAKDILNTIKSNSKKHSPDAPFIYNAVINNYDKGFEVQVHCDGFEKIVDFTDYHPFSSKHFPTERTGMLDGVKYSEIGKWKGVNTND